MAKKYSLKKPESLKQRLVNNKKIAIRLLVSLVVFLSVYFICIRAGFYIMQDIYIFTSFILAMVYAVCALYIAKIKQNKKEKDLSENEKDLLAKLDFARKHLIIIFLPMFAAVVIDAVILFYDSFGISQFLGI